MPTHCTILTAHERAKEGKNVLAHPIPPPPRFTGTAADLLHQLAEGQRPLEQDLRQLALPAGGAPREVRVELPPPVALLPGVGGADGAAPLTAWKRENW